MKEKRYIYKNLRGGWSIATAFISDLGNYPTSLHAIEVAARDCSHVAELDFDAALNLSRSYRDQAEKLWRAGKEPIAADFHGRALQMELVAARLNPGPGKAFCRPAELGAPSEAHAAAQ